MTTSTNVKVCPKCDKSKPRTEFYKDNQSKNAIYAYCKSCCAERSKEYFKTRGGLITKIYNGQIQSSKRRKHNPPNYSLSDLQEWVFSQPNFDSLYVNWKLNNYPKNLIPSIDRLKDKLPYSLDNIRLVAFIENHMKEVNKMNAKKEIPISQYSKEGSLINEFKSIRDAERITGVTASSISRCVRGIRETAGGYRWEQTEGTENRVATCNWIKNKIELIT